MQEMPKKTSFVALFHAKKSKPMKNPIWRNGIYSMLIILGVFTAIQVIWGFTIPYRTSEIIGYLTIFISLAFVFLGIRAYRDEKNGGEITFGKALQIGLLITVFPSTAFAVFTMVQFLLQGEEMMEYYKQNMPAADRQQWGGKYGTPGKSFFSRRTYVCNGIFNRSDYFDSFRHDIEKASRSRLIIYLNSQGGEVFI